MGREQCVQGVRVDAVGEGPRLREVGFERGDGRGNRLAQARVAVEVVPRAIHTGQLVVVQ